MVDQRLPLEEPGRSLVGCVAGVLLAAVPAAEAAAEVVAGSAGPAAGKPPSSMEVPTKIVSQLARDIQAKMVSQATPQALQEPNAAKM